MSLRQNERAVWEWHCDSCGRIKRFDIKALRAFHSKETYWSSQFRGPIVIVDSDHWEWSDKQYGCGIIDHEMFMPSGWAEHVKCIDDGAYRRHRCKNCEREYVQIHKRECVFWTGELRSVNDGDEGYILRIGRLELRHVLDEELGRPRRRYDNDQDYSYGRVRITIERLADVD